jgi:hypothetical protein
VAADAGQAGIGGEQPRRLHDRSKVPGMSAPLLGDVSAVMALAERLAGVGQLDQAETPHDEPPTWTLAVSLGDIEGSCRDLLDDHLPRLVEASSPPEIVDALLDIHFDLQHIVYHLATTPRFRDLIDFAPPLHEEVKDAD